MFRPLEKLEVNNLNKVNKKFAIMSLLKEFLIIIRLSMTKILLDQTCS